MLRSCYITDMQFYSERPDVKVAVAWFFVDDDTPFLPFYTRFASGNWATSKVGWKGVGEVEGSPRIFRDGTLPATFPPDHICGDERQFAEGQPQPPAEPVPQDDMGIPLCCGASMFPPPPVDPCSVDVWEVEASGFTGGCSRWNGTFTLARYPGLPCTWFLQVDSTSRWALNMDMTAVPPTLNAGVGENFPPFGQGGLWSIDLADLDLTPGADNTLDLISNPALSVCTFLPPTILLRVV